MFNPDSVETTVVGLGSAGIKVAALLSKESLLVDRFVYVSCDGDDFDCTDEGTKILIECPPGRVLTPAVVRGLAFGSHQKIRSALNGSRVVFVVAGLGGATGSGLAPLVSSLSNECGATTVGVAVMPFSYEKKMIFPAGVTLRRLRKVARGVIVVDNDTLMRSSPRDTLVNLFEVANKEAVKALGALLSRPSGVSVPLGLNKLLGAVLQDGYALLGMSSSGSADKAEDALAGAVVSIGKVAKAGEANRAVIALSGDGSLSATDIGVVVGRLGPMLNREDVDVEYCVNYSGTSQLQVSLLASGFKSTKYDDYDPLAKVLGDRVLDDEPDSWVPDVLGMVASCE
jgi:cell division protein FtsZ